MRFWNAPLMLWLPYSESMADSMEDWYKMAQIIIKLLHLLFIRILSISLQNIIWQPYHLSYHLFWEDPCDFYTYILQGCVTGTCPKWRIWGKSVCVKPIHLKNITVFHWTIEMLSVILLDVYSEFILSLLHVYPASICQQATPGSH